MNFNVVCAEGHREWKIKPERDEVWGRTRWHCPKCGLDFVMREENAEPLVVQIEAAGIKVVPLRLLIDGAARRHGR